MFRKIAFRIILIAALLIIGFVYLIRSCLARFDERMAVGGGSSASSQFLVFEKDGKGVVFSLVKYDRTTSYSRNGGMVRRSVMSTYYAQANDLATAEKKASERIKKGREISAYPVELLGAAGGKAWLFAGELLAYDPFTLAKLADPAILEQKNPLLKGKLIAERRYYELDPDTKQIRITLADGSIYALDPVNLLVSPTDEPNGNTDEKKLKDLDKQIRKSREARSLAYDRLRKNNQDYQHRVLSAQAYKDSSAVIDAEVKKMAREEDSLEELAKDRSSMLGAQEDLKNRKRDVRRMGMSYGSIKMNTDTMNGRWYALGTAGDMDKEGERFYYRNGYDENARNRLFTAALVRKEGYWEIGEERTELAPAVYLQGGFLLDKETGLPQHTGQDFLLVYKDRIGNEGLIQLARVTVTGKMLWTINTGLKDFYDWQTKGDKLVIAGTDNKELSSGEINLLQIVNVSNGAVVAYDFFKDKKR